MEMNSKDVYETAFGIDEIILYNEMPEDEPLRIKQLHKGKGNEIFCTVDFKSNNLSLSPNPSYLQLLDCLESLDQNNHDEEDIMYDESVKPLLNHFKKDNYTIKRASRRRDLRSKSRELNIFKFLSANFNQTDYFVFLNYAYPRNESINEQCNVYLVPAYQLREQMIEALNILGNGNSDNLIELKGAIITNSTIEAYSILDFKVYTLMNECEIIKDKKKGINSEDIILRLSEKELIFNNIMLLEGGNITPMLRR
jgi:hypothetical protein